MFSFAVEPVLKGHRNLQWKMAVYDRWPYKGGDERNVKAKYFQKESALKAALQTRWFPKKWPCMTGNTES